MKKFSGWVSLFAVCALLAATFAGCSTHEYAFTSPSIVIDAAMLSGYIGAENVVIVDMQEPEAYASAHLEGAVNIPSSEIVINVPVPNMLTSSKKIENVMGEHGISNNCLVIAYDTDRMSASRLLWTLFMYGFENVAVVSGGFDAIQAAGLPVTDKVPDIRPATFTAGEPSSEWCVDMARVREQVDTPSDGVILLDVRSEEEYLSEGKIPTAVMRDYLDNYREDGTLYSRDMTRIMYREDGIFPEDEIIIYCRSSFRAAPVFVQLYEAGYRNIKLYDGAFLEWTSFTDNPVEMPAGAVAPTPKDAS
ncbi:MAG: sulfurtransferase [Lachnospiraceae bacterium]|nr:sulfurtransferase [Lachnospiraceae bacterium]